MVIPLKAAEVVVLTLQVLTLAVLLVRGRVRGFPIFSIFTGFCACWLALQTFTTWAPHFQVFALFDVVSSLIELSLVYEVLSGLVPKGSRLAGSGRRRFFLSAAAGVAVTSLLTFAFDPPGLSGIRLALHRFDIFSTSLLFISVIALLLTAQSLGLGWRSHLFAVGQGLLFWALATVAELALTPYLGGNKRAGLYYDQIQFFLGCAVQIYWCIALWRNEPERRPISPEMRKYIVALHDRMGYDLRRVGH